MVRCGHIVVGEVDRGEPGRRFLQRQLCRGGPVFVLRVRPRRQGPVWREPHHECFVVTGYDEIAEAYRDTDTFSSCNSFGGPFPGLPELPEGDDASALIEQYREVFPSSESLVTFDPPEHADHRGLMMRLLTPKRLKENEAFMWRLADRADRRVRRLGALRVHRRVCATGRNAGDR